MNRRITLPHPAPRKNLKSTFPTLNSIAGKIAVLVSSDKTGGFTRDTFISTFTGFDAGNPAGFNLGETNF